MWNAYNLKQEKEKTEFKEYVDKSLEGVVDEAHRTIADGTGITVFRTPWMLLTRGALLAGGYMSSVELANTTLWCTLTNYIASGKAFSLGRDFIWKKVEPLDIFTKKQYDITYGVVAGGIEAGTSYIVMKYGFDINNISSWATAIAGSALTVFGGGPLGEVIDTERQTLGVKLSEKEKANSRSLFIESNPEDNAHNPFYKILNRSMRFKKMKRYFYDNMSLEEKKNMVHTVNTAVIGGIATLWMSYGALPHIPKIIEGLIEHS